MNDQHLSTTGHTSKYLIVTLLVFFIITLSGCVSPSQDDLQDLTNQFPIPELTPLEVVRIQMEAFQRNDEANRGIEIAFRFASPANRSFTGPIERFSLMIRSGVYAAMLNPLDIEYGSVVQEGPLAQVPVTVYSADGSSWTYLFLLGKQSQNQYDQCWMTESVQFVSTSPPGTRDARNTAVGETSLSLYDV